MSRGLASIGFACSWWRPREPTWSYIPSRLRAALREGVEVVDYDVERSLPVKALLRSVSAPFGAAWQYSRAEDALVDRRLAVHARRHPVDAVLAVGEVYPGAAHRPFLYQDMNVAAALDEHADLGPGIVNLARARTMRSARRAARRRVARYQDASTVFVMSEWFARILTSQYGVPPHRIVVVGAGINHRPSVRPLDQPIRGRLLFVGTHFHRKGGDLVLRAVEHLRGRGLDLTLTIAGPDVWPEAGPVPSWVEFVGLADGPTVASLYADHDLFVMPSRFEAYGIVFLEAQVAGLPCVGRAAYAMPEVLDPRWSRMVSSDDVDELADRIMELLGDTTAHRDLHQANDDLRRQHSWGRVAADMIGRIEDVLSGW